MTCLTESDMYLFLFIFQTVRTWCFIVFTSGPLGFVGFVGEAMGILLLAHGDVVFEVEEEPSEPKLSLGKDSFDSFDSLTALYIFVNSL